MRATAFQAVSRFEAICVVVPFRPLRPPRFVVPAKAGVQSMVAGG